MGFFSDLHHLLLVMAEQFWMALIVHEAGHTFFGIFGSRLVGIIGGNIIELMLPLTIAFSDWFNRKRVTAQLGLLLTTFAWFETSAYAADAMYRQMPLIGNLSKSAHDFYNIFTELNLMSHYIEIA